MQQVLTDLEPVFRSHSLSFPQLPQFTHRSAPVSSNLSPQLQECFTLYYERACHIAKKQYLSDSGRELAVLRKILSAKSVDLSTMHQHGLITPLLILMLDCDQNSTPKPESVRHAQICSETLAELYSLLNSFPLLDDLRNSLVSADGPSDFTYHQLLEAIESSTVHVGGLQYRPTLTTLLQGPLKDELLAFINQSCTANKDTNIKLCSGHTKMHLMVSTATSLFSKYCNSGEHTQKLGPSHFKEILKHTKVDPAELVQTELWSQMIHALNLESLHPLVDSEGILKHMSSYTSGNLHNLLSIQQGDNQQCLRLLAMHLSKEIGEGPAAFKHGLVQFAARGKLLSYVMEQCKTHNLSDRYMSENHQHVWNTLNWYVNLAESSFQSVRSHFEILKQTFDAEAIAQMQQTQQDQQREQRLIASAVKMQAYRCYVQGCANKIPLNTLFCLGCSEAGKVVCTICGKLLTSDPEFKSRMCMDDMDLIEPVFKTCLFCYSEFQSETSDLCQNCSKLLSLS